MIHGLKIYPDQVQAYRTTSAMITDPKKLILMLYDETLNVLFQVRNAILNGDLVSRCEGLSKAIDYISELNASVQGEKTDEAADFLRGLYSSILVELPKVNLTNDVKTVEQSIKYLAQLRSIWQDQVMAEKEIIDAHTIKYGIINQAATGVDAVRPTFSCKG